MGLLWYFRTLHLLFLQEETGVYSCGGDRRNLLVERSPPASPTAGIPTGRVAGGHAPFFAFSVWCPLVAAAGGYLLLLLSGALCSLSLSLLFSALLCLLLCCSCFCFHLCDCRCEGCGECVCAVFRYCDEALVFVSLLFRHYSY